MTDGGFVTTVYIHTGVRLLLSPAAILKVEMFVK